MEPIKIIYDGYEIEIRSNGLLMPIITMKKIDSPFQKDLPYDTTPYPPEWWENPPMWWYNPTYTTTKEIKGIVVNDNTSIGDL